jgi:hypothetical protein
MHLSKITTSVTISYCIGSLQKTYIISVLSCRHGGVGCQIWDRSRKLAYTFCTKYSTLGHLDYMMGEVIQIT